MQLNSQLTINSGKELLNLVQSHILEAQKLSKIPLISIIGPTASGKTSLSIALAKSLNTEIISADSRQVYNFMDIGTAKPSQKELTDIKHHIINVLDPDQPFSLSDFQKEAQKIIQNFYNQKLIPILIGGTGLYISSITENYLLPSAKPNTKIREKYQRLAQEKGNLAVYEILLHKNPELAKTIHPNNLRYVIKAIEKQNTFSHKQNTNSKDNLPYHNLYIQIYWPRPELYQRIELRIDKQIQAGLIDEVKFLLSKYSRDLPSLTSLGYQELANYLDGKTTQEEAIINFKKNTRNYAKRQLTWFRKFNHVYSIIGKDLENILQQLKVLEI